MRNSIRFISTIFLIASLILSGRAVIAQSARHVYATTAALQKTQDTSYSAILNDSPFQFEAGKRYHIRWKGKAGYGDENGGMKLRLNGTATLDSIALTVDGRQMAGAPGFVLPFAATWVNTTLTSNEVSNANPGNYNSLVEIEGVIQIAEEGGGSVVLEMAQAQSSTYTTSLKAGFTFEIDEL